MSTPRVLLAVSQPEKQAFDFDAGRAPQKQAMGLQAQSMEYQKENNALLKEVVEQARETNQLLRVNHLLQVAFEKDGKSTIHGL